MSAEWGAVSLGSLDVTPHAIASSPSNATRDAGFVLNNHEDITIFLNLRRCIIVVFKY
jgi:hypothetical protein